jgi:hypothetical protein
MKLSAEQVAQIETQVDGSDITIETLRDDVVDHLCCAVEIKLKKGNSFENALREAIGELAPDGLHNLQIETVFLLNSNKIILMKKVMYLIGLLSAMSMTIGVSFKLMHLPGAEELSTFGIFGFTLLYLPMLLIDRYKMSIQSALSERLRFMFGIISAVLVGVSLVMKLMHLTGADVVFLGGTAIFAFGFLPFLFFNMYKKSIA